MTLGRDEPYLKRWLGNNGSFLESWQYFTAAMSLLVMTLQADRTALHDDLFHHPTQPFAPFLLGQMEYLKQNLQPNGHAMLQLNTTGYNNGASQVPFESNRVFPTSMYPISWLADQENSALKDKFRKFVADAAAYAAGATGYPITRDGAPYIPFLFFDADGAKAEWADEPLGLANMSNPQGGWMHVFMRSDWTTDGVLGSFMGGVPTADAGNGKEMYDRGALQVQRGSTHLLVNTRGECFRNLPARYVTPEEQAQATMAMSCYSTVQTQGANQSYLGSTAYSVFYLLKPGQQEGPLRYMVQTFAPQMDGPYMPWTPGSDGLPDQQLGVSVNADTDVFTITSPKYRVGAHEVLRKHRFASVERIARQPGRVDRVEAAIATGRAAVELALIEVDSFLILGAGSIVLIRGAGSAEEAVAGIVLRRSQDAIVSDVIVSADAGRRPAADQRHQPWERVRRLRGRGIGVIDPMLGQRGEVRAVRIPVVDAGKSARAILEIQRVHPVDAQQ